ncbi:hypothetical protein cypCar_00046382 [Cyprinus carpio]|nr:hypothetical protein cypCar_00046382 [Cyprinus carpio]
MVNMNFGFIQVKGWRPVRDYVQMETLSHTPVLCDRSQGQRTKNLEEKKESVETDLTSRVCECRRDKGLLGGSLMTRDVPLQKCFHNRSNTWLWFL